MAGLAEYKIAARSGDRRTMYEVTTPASAIRRRTGTSRVMLKPIKIGAKVVSHGRYATLQLAEVAVPRRLFAEIPSLIARLRVPPAPA